MQYYIKEREWEVIFASLQTIKGIHINNELSLRIFIEAIWYMARSGCQWRLLPLGYGHFRAVHMRFKDWSDRGIWEALFKIVAADPDMEAVMIDATIVRAHACSAGYKKDSQRENALDRSKGGFTTKIHALVDALGNPLKFILTPGQKHDVTQAEDLIKDIKNTMVLADKGYDSNELVKTIEQKNSVAVIPPRKNRKALREWDCRKSRTKHRGSQINFTFTSLMV